MITPASPIALVPGEPRHRMLIKQLLAHLEWLRPQHWIGLDFPEERIHSRPAVHVIALEETGRTTAVEHLSLTALVGEDERAARWLTTVAPLESDLALHVEGSHIDIAVSEGRDARQVELTHLASGLRTWCARRLATLPEGTSAHVITAYGTPVRVDVEKTGCPGEHGRLSIFPREPPATFATAVTVCLNDQLETLLAASTDRRVLLFENSCRLWSVGQLRTELEASLEFPGLSRIDETWMVDVTASVFNEGPTFRRVTP